MSGALQWCEIWADGYALMPRSTRWGGINNKIVFYYQYKAYHACLV